MTIPGESSVSPAPAMNHPLQEKPQVSGVATLIGSADAQRSNMLLTSTIAPEVPVGSHAKRLVDIVLAISGIILLAPLLIICVLVTDGGPILYRHRRVGFGGKYFDCLKFRTMVLDAQERLQKLLESDPVAAAEWAANQKLYHDPRVTAIGSVLRKSSLDELPQLFNVLRGDMSMIGPRPVTEDELRKYGSRQHAYLACRPGITGLWQVSGRSTTTYQKRVACDFVYSRRWSMLLDAKILITTIPALMFLDGAY